jgi:hypothetical protein
MRVQGKEKLIFKHNHDHHDDQHVKQHSITSSKAEINLIAKTSTTSLVVETSTTSLLIETSTIRNKEKS